MYALKFFIVLSEEWSQVTLKNLEDQEGSEELVYAKFVIGSDGKQSPQNAIVNSQKSYAGAHSWVRKELCIEMEGDQTGGSTPYAHLRALLTASPYVFQTRCGVSSTCMRRRTSQTVVAGRSYTHTMARS